MIVGSKGDLVPAMPDKSVFQKEFEDASMIAFTSAKNSNMKEFEDGIELMLKQVQQAKQKQQEASSPATGKNSKQQSSSDTIEHHHQPFSLPPSEPAAPSKKSGGCC